MPKRIPRGWLSTRDDAGGLANRHQAAASRHKQIARAVPRGIGDYSHSSLISLTFSNRLNYIAGSFASSLIVGPREKLLSTTPAAGQAALVGRCARHASGSTPGLFELRC